jgi:hypothetical protein
MKRRNKMVKQLIMVLVLCFGLTGCSLLPRITFDKAGVTPTSTQKSQKKESCAGAYTVDASGKIISCSKGYSNYENNYSQKERVLTLQEKLANFIRSLAGWGFWGVILLIILCPSLLGLIAGRLFEGVYGIGTKAFRQVSAAIQKVKDTTPSLITALEASTDEDVRKFIKEFKDKNGIK